MFGFFAAPGLSTASFLQVTADQPQAGNHICIRPCRRTSVPQTATQQKEFRSGTLSLAAPQKKCPTRCWFLLRCRKTNEMLTLFFYLALSSSETVRRWRQTTTAVASFFQTKRARSRACEQTASQPLSCCCWGRCGRDVRRLQPCSSVSWSTISRSIDVW